MARDPMAYRTPVWQDWCPGCGNYGIVAAVYRAFAELGLDPRRTVIVSGIGCSGKLPHFVAVNGVHTLHGRAIAFATGIKVANPELTVIVHGGDGDLLGIGMAHFVALGRRNLDITVVLHNNRVYGLTKGQASPTLPRGGMSKGMEKPNIQDPVDPVAVALTSGYTFVARSYAFNGLHLKEVLKRAIQHKGAALVEVLQPCATYDKVHTPAYYRERVRDVEKEGWDPIVHSPEEAFEKRLRAVSTALATEDRIPIGVFYQDTHTPTLEDRIAARISAYTATPPARKRVDEGGRPLISKERFRELFRDFIIKTR